MKLLQRLTRVQHKTSAAIQYSMTTIDGGIHLCIWEDAHVTDVRVKPFLFKVNYRLPSSDEAEKLLDDYLENLGSTSSTC
jgi:hypothetical protein